MSCTQNIRVEPCDAYWKGEFLGKLDGDIEISTEDQMVEITTHQTGQEILDLIRNGKLVEVAMTLKEVSAAQFERIYGASGGESTAATEVSRVVTVADVAGSLNNKYFFLNAALDATKYYVWFNVNSAGTDPALAGYTAIPVALATGASANSVASAIQAAVDALAPFVATVSTNTVTITNASVGSTTDLSDGPTGSSTGFTLSVVTQGQTAGVWGWGSSKQFESVRDVAGKLVLHPVRLASTDVSADLCFWIAYPMPESIVRSGENPQTISCTFKVMRDCDRQAGIDLFVFGDSR